MTTRSGLTYKSTAMSTTEEGATPTDAVNVVTLIRMLLEDRKAREEDLARERERREAADTIHSRHIAEQLDMMKLILDRTVLRDGDDGRERAEGDTRPPEKVILSKLSDGDDIEAFLTTFE